MSQQYYYNPFGNSSDVNEAREEYLVLKNKRKAEKREIRTISFMMGCAIILYLVVQMAFASVLKVFNLYDLFYESSLFNYASSIILSVASVALPFGIMALVNRRRYTNPVIPNEKIGSGIAFLWVCFGVFCCVLSNVAVAYISQISQSLFGFELTQGDIKKMLPGSAFECVVELIAMAVVPAISEEFAMRCCSLQLFKKYGKGFSVFAVSIVFGLLHGNIVQFIFAFFVGLILGYVTVKTNNIMPAIFIHFINNSMSVVQDIAKSFVSDKAAEYVVGALYISFLILGIVSVICLAVKKQFSKKKEKNVSLLSNAEKFISFLFPWMIVPFVILILLTITTIKKV